LSNVQTSLEFVMEGHQGPLPEGVNEWLSRANTNVQTVLSLINELLEIERIEAGSLNLDYAEVELEELMRRSVAAVSALAQRKQITIETPQVADQYIDADEDRLLRVFINLLGNALKFSDKGKTITISFKELTESVEFSVADQGRGIPPDQMEKIFDRYHQVTADDARKLGGSGLGLAITKAIIEAHGGTIVAQSEVDKGSTFTLRIPKKKPGKSERQEKEKGR
jgi:signal transduction histidine kinase